MIKIKVMLAGFLLAIASVPINAGTSCTKREVSTILYTHAGQKALEVNQRLNQLNPKVALIARVGSDLRRYGLHYSHVAFVVKNYPGKPGKWTVVHLLNECGTEYSSIYSQGLMNFFLDDLFTLEYQITLLDSATQEQLYQALQPKKLHRLHNKRYNMIAYPFSDKYQNSNQWVLEVIASVLNTKSPVTRGNEQRYLHKTGYKPSVIKIDALSKMGATLFNTHVQFDDHPQQEKRLGHYSTVSVDSVVAYLKLQGALIENRS